MASQAALLHLGEVGDDCLAIASHYGLSHSHGCFMNLSAEAPELSGIGSKPSEDAHLRQHGRLSMLGDFWYQIGNPRPALLGNRSSNGLNVASELFHFALQDHWFRRFGSLGVEDRSRGEQGRDQSAGMG